MASFLDGFSLASSFSGQSAAEAELAREDADRYMALNAPSTAHNPPNALPDPDEAGPSTSSGRPPLMGVEVEDFGLGLSGRVPGLGSVGAAPERERVGAFDAGPRSTTLRPPIRPPPPSIPSHLLGPLNVRGPRAAQNPRLEQLSTIVAATAVNPSQAAPSSAGAGKLVGTNTTGPGGIDPAALLSGSINRAGLSPADSVSPDYTRWSSPESTDSSDSDESTSTASQAQEESAVGATPESATVQLKGLLRTASTPRKTSAQVHFDLPESSSSADAPAAPVAKRRKVLAAAAKAKAKPTPKPKPQSKAPTQARPLISVVEEDEPDSSEEEDDPESAAAVEVNSDWLSEIERGFWPVTQDLLEALEDDSRSGVTGAVAVQGE